MTERKPAQRPSKPKPSTRQVRPKPAKETENKYAPKPKVAAPNISPPQKGIARVGLGKLKVIEQNPKQYDA